MCIMNGGGRESKMTKVLSIKKVQKKVMQCRPECMNYEWGEIERVLIFLSKNIGKVGPNLNLHHKTKMG